MYLKSLLTLLIAIILNACNHNNENSAHTEPEEEKVQYTVYNEHFELFAEADPFVAGQMSNILSHFSNLPEFTSFSGSSVTLKIIVSGKAIEQTIDSTARKGIYSFDIRPEVSGDGTMEYLLKTDSGDYKIIVPEVRVYSNTQEAKELVGKNMISRTNTTVFTKEQSWKVEFSTGYPVRQPFGQVIKTTAQVQSAKSDEVLVTANTSGVISLSGINILEGIDVEAGQTLMTVKGSGFAENNSAVRYTEAKNNFDKAKAEYERASLLAADKIVSEKQLLEAKAQFENARAVYENLGQNYSAAGQKVICPLTGFIKQLYFKNGEYVETGQTLVVVSQNKLLLLRAEIQQRNAQYLNSIHTATIRSVEDNKTYTLEELNGRFLSIGKTTTQDNFLIPLTLQIDNKGFFVPGSFVELYLKTISDSQALIVPNSAIIEEQGNFFVYVQITPELFEKRQIITGVTDGIKTQIIRGLTDDERIVTKGAIMVRLAHTTGSLDPHSGHVH